jgi:hypothetical protein
MLKLDALPALIPRITAAHARSGSWTGRGLAVPRIAGAVSAKADAAILLSAAADRDRNESALAVPIVDTGGRFVYAVVLRGRALFTPGDTDALRSIQQSSAIERRQGPK